MGYEDQFKKADDEGVIEQLSPDYKKWEEEGATVCGLLVARDSITSRKSESSYFQYVFKTDAGPVKCAMGANFDREVGPFMIVGGIYRIKYLGKDKLEGGRSVNRFEASGISHPAEEHVGGEEDISF